LDPNDLDLAIPVFLVSRCIPFDVANRNRRMDSAFDLILPKSYGMDFWLSFVFSGCKPCGLLDVKCLLLDYGVPVFPDDFPGSPAYNEHSDRLKIENAAKHSRSPPAKRINYEACGERDPFEGRIEFIFAGILHSKSFVHCMVILLKGVPKRLARIYRENVLIGLVTSATFSLSLGTSVGIGVCFEDAIDKAEVFVRNMGSNHRYKSVLKRVDSGYSYSF
jgi:glycine cleavage system aminomethyltransferase T